MNLSPRTVENEYAIPMSKKLQLRSCIGLALFSWLSGIGRINEEENVAWKADKSPDFFHFVHFCNRK